jgi:hypothetical protein
MNGQLILREWKEKIEIPVLFLALLAVVVGLLLAVADEGEAPLLLAGSAVLVLLPFLGLMIGAVAFSVENRDGAWAYLFSRPVRKSTVWLSKFVALLGYLALTLLVYYVVLSRLPGVQARLDEFGFEVDLLGRISPWTLGLILAFSLFVIAFALSLLTDKLFQIVFLSLILFAGFYVFLLVLFLVVRDQVKPQAVFLVPAAWFLAVAGLAAASLVSFGRADFSQPRRKALGFAKWSALFLVPALVCLLAAAAVSRWFLGEQYVWVDQVRGGSAYIVTNRGSYRYDAARDRLRKLPGINAASWGGQSAGVGRVVWIKETVFKKAGRRYWRQDLWTMDEEGRNVRPLLLTAESKEPSFAGQSLLNIEISPDGRRVLFNAQAVKRLAIESTVLWSINADGTGLRSYAEGAPAADMYYCRGWSPDGSKAIVHVLEKRDPEDKRWLKRRSRLYKLSLDSGAWEPFPEHVPASYYWPISPDGKRLVYLLPDSDVFNAPRNRLVLIDLESYAETEALRIPDGQFAYWSPDGGRIAVLNDKGARLSLVSPADRSILAERSLPGGPKERGRQSLAWADDGRKLVLGDHDESGPLIRVFDAALKTETLHAVPGKRGALDVPSVFGLPGGKILVGLGSVDRLWVFDLATEKWKKLFG